MSNIQFTSSIADNGQQFLTVFADGTLLPPVDDSHPNFKRIKDMCLASFDGESVDTAYLISLFDVSATVEAQFARLSDRVAVRNGVITLDGDPVHGTLQEQILQFLDAGEEFAPLVEFYEKLLTNPLGDVREGLYDWISGQRAEGNFTITPEGDILGYKAFQAQPPEWRTDAPDGIVYVPSRRGEGIVNGREVRPTEFIEQLPGDVVEMPRSRVLHAPSAACGDGLHIGTYAYARTFLVGGKVALVKFSPRDIVSLPDRNSTWKLRVCRYEVIDIVDEPLEVPLWSPKGVEAPVEDTRALAEFRIGDRVYAYGIPGEVIAEEDDEGDVLVRFEDSSEGYCHPIELSLIEDEVEDEVEDEFQVGDRVIDPEGDAATVVEVHADGRVEVEYDSDDFGNAVWPADEL
jgi:hypothetical protein